MRWLLAILTLLAFPLEAHAGGLFTPDVGSIAVGRGGAWTARASDVSGALYYNPAGLWQVDGWTLSGGLNLHSTRRTFQRFGGDGGAELGTWNVGADGFRIYEEDADGNVVRDSRDEPYPLTVSNPHVRPIPEIGIAFGIPNPDITIALGLYAPPAPIQSWDPQGPGRYRLIEQELIQGNFVLSAAYKPLPWLAFGASFQVLYMQLTESFAGSADFLAGDDPINPEDPDWDVTAQFTARDIKPYFNVGVMFMPLPWLRFGVSFDPPYTFKGKGSASLSGVLGQQSQTLELIGDGALHVVGEDTDVTVNAGLPGHLRFGVDVEPIPKVLMIGLDVHLEIWRGSGDLFADDVDIPLYFDDPDDDLEPEPLVDYMYRVGLCPLGAGLGVDCGDEGSAPPGAGSSLAIYRGEGGSGQVVVPANYRDTWSLRLGAEVRPVPFLGLRAGWLYEPPAIPDNTMTLTIHDGHKHMVAGGASLLLGAGKAQPRSLVEVHLTYSHVFYKDRVIAPGTSRKGLLALDGVPASEVDAGTYTAAVNQLGINMALHFGAIGQRIKAGKGAAKEQTDEG